MTLEDYNKWIEMLKTVEIRKGNHNLLQEVFKFSPENFSKSKGLDTESFVKQFQKERKIIHHRLIDFNKIQILKKRKLKIEKYTTGGKTYDARICVCIKRFKNEEPRAKGGYDFYETIQYNYVIIYDSFFEQDDTIIFDDKGKRVYSTVDEFNKHFIDIREEKIDQLLK
jgi:hypothetical protein